MTARVVGIDLSLTCTGVAWIIGGPAPAVDVATVTSKGRRADELAVRRTRLRTITAQVLDLAAPAVLAAVEAPAFRQAGEGGSVDRYGLWWAVVDGLMAREIAVVAVVPSSMKKAIADSGSADKAAVAIAVERLWPGLEVSSSDVSDAVGLAHLAAVRLGWSVKTLDRHRAVKAAWPSLPDPEVAS